MNKSQIFRGTSIKGLVNADDQIMNKSDFERGIYKRISKNG